MVQTNSPQPGVGTRSPRFEPHTVSSLRHDEDNVKFIAPLSALTNANGKNANRRASTTLIYYWETFSLSPQRINQAPPVFWDDSLINS